MGFCTNCGRPCDVCSGEADDFRLLTFPEECRHLITVVLKKMNMNNETDQSIMVKGLMPYKDNPKIINNAMKEYIQMVNPPKSIPYVVAMVRGKAVNRKQRRLDALPPTAKGYEDES